MAVAPVMKDLLAGEENGYLNVHGQSRDKRARLLSNFAPSPFSLGGIWLASVAGFTEGIKFPPGDERRMRAFVSVGLAAKKIGESAERREVYWMGHRINYGSAQHLELVVQAVRAKFAQNPECMEALRATGDLVLVHETDVQDPPSTSLPGVAFCRILTEIRRQDRERE